MRRSAWWFLCAGVFALAGCVREVPLSLSGLVAPDGSNQVFDPELLGEWYDSKWDKVAWRVARDGDSKDYLITRITPDGKEVHSTGYLVELGNKRFLDLKITSKTLFGSREIHAFFKTTISNNLEFRIGTAFGDDQVNQAKVFNGAKLRKYHTLDLRVLDQDRLAKNPDLLKRELIPQGEGKAPNVMITAFGAKLRAFVADHADDESMWVNDTIVLHTGGKREPSAEPEHSAFRFFKKG